MDKSFDPKKLASAEAEEKLASPSSKASIDHAKLDGSYKKAGKENMSDTIPKLLHELQTHQIELETQNENLRKAYAALEESHNRYIDLYDFAPVAYLTLSELGLIEEINLTGAKLLGIDRQKLLQQRFAGFVNPSSSDRWHLFFAQLLEQNQQQTIDLILTPHATNAISFYARLACLPLISHDNHKSLRIVLTDITTLKQAEQVLCGDEAYQSILATTLDGFWAVSLQGKLLDVNHRYCEQSGYSREELLTMQVTDLEAIEAVEDTASHIQRIIKIGGDQFESIHRCKDGTFWHAEVSVTYDPNKIIFYSFFRDITERKRMEETLKISEAFTVSILNSLTAHIAVLDNQGIIVAVNRAWQLFNQQNGFPDVNQNMLGHSYLDVCIKAVREKKCQGCDGCEEVEEILRGIKAVMAGEQPEFHAEYPCHAPTEQRWFYMTVLPLQGIKQGVVISHENITERKQMELELRIAAVAFESQEAMVITDTKNVILRINKAFTESTGYTAQEVVGQKMNILKSGQQDAAFYSAMWEIILKTGSWQGEIWDRRKNGEIYPKWLSITAVKDNEGMVTHYVGIHTDITERKRREEEIKQLSESALNKAKLEAEKASRAKSDFLSSMSHELRTPMNAVLGFAQLLENDDLTEDQHDSVEEILTAGHHLMDLINEVLDLSKVESEKLEIKLEKTDLRVLVHNCITLINPLTFKNDIKIVDNITTVAYSVIADPLRLKQVLLNLISNAIKYNRIGGSITLYAETINSQTLRINVADTGNGLSEQQLAKLFQPFERLSAKNSNIEGTGIGLCISKKLIGAMNGSIGVNSSLGEGSCFWIEIPLA